MTCSHTHPYDDPSRLHSKLLPNVCRPIFGLYPWKYLAHYYRRPGPLQHFQFVDIGMARSKSNPLYDKSTEALLFSIVAPNICLPVPSSKPQYAIGICTRNLRLHYCFNFSVSSGTLSKRSPTRPTSATATSLSVMFKLSRPMLTHPGR
jgi:hypothetical protein